MEEGEGLVSKLGLVTLLDFLGPNTFRARNLNSPIRLQHCPSLIKLRVLPFATSRQSENTQEVTYLVPRHSTHR